MGKKKEKKPKVKYIDDGRTIADMSGLQGVDKRYTGPKGGFKAQLRTYWNTVKLMFVPMMVTIGIITLAFLIMWIMLTLSYTIN
ncbi:MAG: hypothetical protein IJW53_02625 [Clostridia bacterium]|nr:hypothetical protein [Clostridia bacterium]